MCKIRSIFWSSAFGVADLYGEALPLLRAGGVVLNVEQCLDQSEVRIVVTWPALHQSQLTWSVYPDPAKAILLLRLRAGNNRDLD